MSKSKHTKDFHERYPFLAMRKIDNRENANEQRLRIQGDAYRAKLSGLFDGNRTTFKRTRARRRCQ